MAGGGGAAAAPVAGNFNSDSKERFTYTFRTFENAKKEIRSKMTFYL